MKRIILTICLLSVICSCSSQNANKDNGLLEFYTINMDSEKEFMQESLAQMERRGVIDKAQSELVLNCLVADWQSIAENKIALTCEELDLKAANTLEKLQGVRATVDFYELMTTEYASITTENSMKDGDDSCNPNIVIWEWWQANQTFDDRIYEMRRRLEDMQTRATGSRSQDAAKQSKEIAAEVNKDIDILQRSESSDTTGIVEIVEAARAKYRGRQDIDESILLDVGYVYNLMASSKGLDMSSETMDWASGLK